MLPFRAETTSQIIDKAISKQQHCHIQEDLLIFFVFYNPIGNESKLFVLGCCSDKINNLNVLPKVQFSYEQFVLFQTFYW